MIQFYCQQIEGDLAFFPAEESRHLVQVLRRKEGDPVEFVDGRGGWYAGLIEGGDRKELQVRVIERKQLPARPFRLHLAIAPTKQMARLEWLLEKCTEIGIEEFTFLACSRSERTRIRTDRMERIVLGAMKQSLRAYLPRVNGLVPFSDFVARAGEEARFIAWCESPVEQLLQDNLPARKDVTILIGPEGDFTPEEVRQAETNGYRPVSLGPHRLRTETAGLAACMTVNLINT